MCAPFQGFSPVMLSSVSQNKGLDSVDSMLDGLVHLRHVDLSKNKLSGVAALSGLTSLQSALLDDNNLTDLPKLKGLPYLQVLVANNNVIKSWTANESPSLIQLSLNGKLIVNHEPLQLTRAWCS